MSVVQPDIQDVQMSDASSTIINENQTVHKLRDHVSINSPSTIQQQTLDISTDISTDNKDMSMSANLSKMPPISVDSKDSSESESTKSSDSTSPAVKNDTPDGHSKTPMVKRINTLAKSSTSFASVSVHSSALKMAQSAQEPTDIIKTNQETLRLKEVLGEISWGAAQKALREEWRRFLFEGFESDSGDHLSFILRAILKNLKWNPRLINILLHDPVIMQNIIDHPTTIPDLLGSVTHTQLVRHVSHSVLDQALAERLKNVEATSLVRWLSEANRLGYKSDDILDEEDESVRPNRPSSDEPEFLHVEPARPALNIPPPMPQQQHDPLLAEQERNLRLMGQAAVSSKRQKVPNGGQIGSCPDCDAVFQTMSGYSYHLNKKLCTKTAPLSGWKVTCANCMRGFTQHGGYKYHVDNAVCSRVETPATSPSAQLQQEANQVPQGQFPSPSAMPGQPQSTPVYAPIRPPMNQAAPQAVQAPIPSHQGPPLSRPPINRPAAPPVSTPTWAPKGARRHVSELSPAERAKLDAELTAEEARYAEVQDDINKAYKDTPVQLSQKLVSAKNGHNTKMSVIRKAHGATLRMRHGDKDLRKMDTPTSTPMHMTPPTPSFSPVNGSGSGSKTAPRPSAYAPPPILPPMSQRPPMISSTYQALPASTQGPASSVGYRTSFPHAGPSNGYTGPYLDPPSNRYTGPYLDPPSNKRRRSQNDDHGSPRPNGPNHDVPRPQPWFASPKGRNISAPQSTSTGLAMMEMRSEDAAAKFATSGTRKPGRPSNGGPVRAPSSAVPRPVPGSGTKDSAIILTDTESENEPTIAASIEKDE